MQRLFLCLFLGQEVGIWKILASQRDIQSWNQPNVLRRVAGDKRTQTDRPARGAQSELNKLEAVSKGTESMFQQMAARSKMLTAQNNEGNQKVAAYQKGIANLNTVVKTSQREQQAIGEKITQAKDKLAQSEEKVKSLADVHKAA